MNVAKQTDTSAENTFRLVCRNLTLAWFCINGIRFLNRIQAIQMLKVKVDKKQLPFSKQQTAWASN